MSRPDERDTSLFQPLFLALALIAAGFVFIGERTGNWPTALAFAGGAGAALLLGFAFGRFLRRAAERGDGEG